MTLRILFCKFCLQTRGWSNYQGIFFSLLHKGIAVAIAVSFHTAWTMFNGTQPPSSATTRLPHVGWCSSWDLLIGKSSSVLSLVGNFGEWMDVGMCLRVWINTRIGVEAEFRVPRTGKSLLRQEKEHCPDLELCYCDGGSQVRHFNWFVWRSCWKADARSAPMGLWSRSVVGTGIIFFYKLLRKSCYTVLSVNLSWTLKICSCH